MSPIIGGALGLSTNSPQSSDNATSAERILSWSATMVTVPGSKLKFEEAYPDDLDVFNDWHAGPVPVTREEAARGLRRARRLGRVQSRGSHTYCLVGMNTVLLRPRRLCTSA